MAKKETKVAVRGKAAKLTKKSKATSESKVAKKTKKAKKSGKLDKIVKPKSGSTSASGSLEISGISKVATKKFKVKKVRENKKTSKRKGDWGLTDLRGASYNPRFITARRLDNLGKSYEEFGDLSGIVFNRRSGHLVSGHQRTSSIRKKGYETKIITNPIKDCQHGTIEEGFMTVILGDNRNYRIPFRVVDWSDKKVEFAANIAANAHGGEFDNSKLAFMVEELEIRDGGFDIDTMGLDALKIKTLPELPSLGSSDESTDSKSKGKGPASFEEYGEDTFDDELDQCCPRCKYRFAGK